MAWLKAAPKRHKKDEDPKSRFESLDDDNPSKSLPEADTYLIKCFRLIGLFLDVGMGRYTLTWSEIDAFSTCSGYPLTGWESEQIILMSRAYVNYSHKAKELSCPSPFNLAASDDDAMEANRKIVNDRFLAMLGSAEK